MGLCLCAELANGNLRRACKRVLRIRLQLHKVSLSGTPGNSGEVADGGMRMRSNSMRLPAAEVLTLPLQRLA